MARYCIAHVLCSHPGRAVQKLRTDISAIFDVHAALAAPPHLTFFAPIHAARTRRLIVSLAWMAHQQTPFSVPLRGFVAAGTQAWFVEPEPSPELLDLHGDIAELMEDMTGEIVTRTAEPSRLRIALAGKDMTSDVHGRIGAYLAKQPLPVRHMPVDSLSLLRRDRVEGTWVETSRFPFRGLLP